MGELYVGAVMLYLMRVAIFVGGAWKERKRIIGKQDDGAIDCPFVSVIVPARNEEKNIGNCLDSLLKSSYPADRFEVIAVNDRSSDRTLGIMQEYSVKHSHIVCVDLQQERTGNLRGKPGALHEAASRSKGEILMMTDADCTVGRDWISSMTRQYSTENIGLVASFTTLRAQTFFEQMQSVEWVLNHTMASAGVALGQPLGCFGNNLSIRRSAYDSVGGYAGIPFSVTEDLALLQTVTRNGWEARYPCMAESVVRTEACETFGEYVRQHQRWLRGGTALGWRGAVFVLFSASLWIVLAAAAFNGDWLLIPFIFALRLAGDMAVVAPTLRQLNRNDQYLWVCLAVGFIAALELALPLSLLRRTVEWKGQIFR